MNHRKPLSIVALNQTAVPADCPNLSRWDQTPWNIQTTGSRGRQVAAHAHKAGDRSRALIEVHPRLKIFFQIGLTHDLRSIPGNAGQHLLQKLLVHIQPAIIRSARRYQHRNRIQQTVLRQPVDHIGER